MCSGDFTLKESINKNSLMWMMIIKFSQNHIPQFQVDELHLQGIFLRKKTRNNALTDITI